MAVHMLHLQNIYMFVACVQVLSVWDIFYFPAVAVESILAWRSNTDLGTSHGVTTLSEN